MKEFYVLYVSEVVATSKPEIWADYVSKVTGLPTLVLPVGFELVQMAGDLELE